MFVIDRLGTSIQYLKIFKKLVNADYKARVCPMLFELKTWFLPLSILSSIGSLSFILYWILYSISPWDFRFEIIYTHIILIGNAYIFMTYIFHHAIKNFPLFDKKTFLKYKILTILALCTLCLTSVSIIILVIIDIIILQTKYKDYKNYLIKRKYHSIFKCKKLKKQVEKDAIQYPALDAILSDARCCGWTKDNNGIYWYLDDSLYIYYLDELGEWKYCEDININSTMQEFINISNSLSINYNNNKNTLTNPN